jgi:outer membrane receptor protein involved in Fe transport
MIRTQMRAGLVMLAAALHGIAWAEEENPAAQLEAPSVEVVGTTPLAGIGTAINEVPSNVQAVTGAQMRQQESVSLPDFANNNIGSVSINEGPGNPFQPDVNFRGFQGGPLLGVPQGLSAFQDGVRINESFGDTINWDLIPQGAISSMNLIPGSNPVFGLNTLGGALGINMKSGREYPGGDLSLFGGSYGTYSGNFEFGGAKDNFDYYIYGNYFDSDGWRDYSSSLIRQVFGKVGYQTADFDVDLSYTFADNTLNGIQALPMPMYSSDPSIAYSWPDTTDNKLNFLNLRLSKVFEDDQILAGNVYWRQYKSFNVGSNVNDEFDGSNPGNACDGTPGDSECPGSNDASDIDTDGLGAALQYTLLTPIASRKNSFTLGASYDYGSTDFTLEEQEAVFSSLREAVGVEDFEVETQVTSKTTYTGFYFTDTFGITDQLLLTLAGRYNIAQIKIQDELGNNPDVNGTNTYRRFNPAIGLNFNPNPAINTYISYNEGMRAPTAIELTCADPAAPCPLPNAFLSDPPLDPVIAKTFELGGRGAIGLWGTNWTAAIYRADLDDDIQFVSTGGGGNVGYFTNIPKTRRQGVELGLQQRLGPVLLTAAYGYVDATYQAPFTVSSPNNSQADANGDIQVESGDSIPGIPKNNFKLRADWRVMPKLFLGATVAYFSSQYARGDENNEDANGQVPGYTVVNLDGRYQITDRLQVFGRISNLFDTDYATVGVLGEDFFSGPGFSYDRLAAAPSQFRTPGAPFGIWVGLTYSFGKPAGTASAAGD